MQVLGGIRVNHVSYQVLVIGEVNVFEDERIASWENERLDGRKRKILELRVGEIGGPILDAADQFVEVREEVEEAVLARELGVVLALGGPGGSELAVGVHRDGKGVGQLDIDDIAARLTRQEFDEAIDLEVLNDGDLIA